MNPYENLEHLFEQARKSPPLLDKEEVKQMLSSPGPVVKPQRLSSTKIWIVGAAATIVIYGVVYFVSQNNSDPATKQSFIITDTTIKEEPHQNLQIVKEIPLQISSGKKAEKLEATNTTNAENLSVKNNQSIETKTEELVIYPGASSGNYPKRIEDEKSDDAYLHLTNEELAKLGIITDGNTLKYIKLTDTTRISDDGGSSLAYSYNIDIEKYGSISTHNVEKYDSVIIHDISLAMPMIIYINDEKKSTPENIFIGDHNVPGEYSDKYISEVKQSLVPVIVHTKGKPMVFSHDDELVFWFKNNEAFRNALPENLRYEARNSYPEFNEKEYDRYVQSLINSRKNNEARYAVSIEKRRELRTKWLTLSKHDLKKLHVKFDGKKFLYDQTYKNVSGEFVRKKLIISPDNFINYNYGKVPHLFTSASDNSYAWYTTDTTMSFILNFVDEGVNETKDKQYFERIRSTKKTFIERIDSMIPVYIAFDEKEIAKSKDKLPIRNQILWFPKNEVFLKKLPKDIAAKINATDNDVDLAKFNSRKINIAPLKLLQLNNEELSGLGIKVNHHGVTVPTAHDNGKTSYTTYNKEGTGQIAEIKNDSVKSYIPEIAFHFNFSAKSNMQPVSVFEEHSLPTTIDRIFAEPILVTDDLGNYWRSYKTDFTLSDEDKEYINKTHQLSPSANERMHKADSIGVTKLILNISTMIPVLVRTGDTYTDEDKKNQNWRPDVILWYEPTDSFFASLPKKLADEIKSEYTAIKSNQPTLSCKYFEACQAVKGKINEYSAYPNPTNDDLNVVIDLAEERKLTFSLTDISGKVVKSFGTDLIQPKGKKEYRFQIGEVKEGMYLLLIESDKGERVTQRIIKK